MPGQGSMARPVGLLAQEGEAASPCFLPVHIRAQRLSGVYVSGERAPGRGQERGQCQPHNCVWKAVGTLEDNCPWGLQVSLSSDSTETNLY